MTQPNGSPPAETTQALTPYAERQIALREQMSQDAAPRAIVPRTFAEAQAFATSLAASTLVPEKLRDRAPDVLMIVLAGAELEIPPVRALSLFHVIEGVPKLSADGIAGVCMANPLCEYLEPVEQSDERVTWAAKKRGRPEIRLSWTKADADRAGLFRPTRTGAPSNHTKYPRQMLNARCKADLCRLVWPEVCSGLVSAEEARDMIETRDLEMPSSQVFTAPPPPPAPVTTSAPLNVAMSTPPPTKTKSTSKPKPPIDVSSTPSSTSSAPASSSTSSASPSSTKPSDARVADQVNPTPPASEQSSTPSPSGSSAPTPPISPDATESISATEPSESSVSVADEDGLGEEQPKAPAGSPDVTPTSAHPPALKFEQYKVELANATAKTINVVKDRWVPWSRQGMEGNPFATEMRTLFGKKKAELG